MKKISLIFLVFISLSTYAQSTENTSTDTIVSPILAKKNELKLDVLNLTAFGKLGISYERFLNQDFQLVSQEWFLIKKAKMMISLQMIPEQKLITK